MSEVVIVRENVPMVKVSGVGRKKGSGCNLQALEKLTKPEMCLEVTEHKMHSLRNSARTYGIKLKIRRVPALSDNPDSEPKRYYLWRVFP